MVPDEVEVRTKTTKNRGNKAAVAAYNISLVVLVR